MGNYCGSNDSKLEKAEKEELFYLLKKTETRTEFFKKLHDLSQYNYSLSKTKTRQIFEILKETITHEKKYQDKFHCLIFLSMIFKKYEKARERFAADPLMLIVLDSIRQETAVLHEYLNVDKIKLWKERYIITCIEIMCFLVQYNKSLFQKYSDFLASCRVDISKEPFYTKITFPLITDVKTNAG